MSRRAVVVALAAMLVPIPARGDDTPVAEQLFLEGKRLMNEKRYEEACAKFKASHDLDASATGTLLNLALCHEQLGKNATAWAEYRQVLAESTGKREDRVAFAREHIAKIEPVMSYLTVVVPPETRTDGLTVALDGVTIAAAAWGTELPTDPGEHVVEAGAPKKVASKDRVVVAGSAHHARIVVRPLADVPFVVDKPPPEPEPDTTRRNVGIAVGVVGLAAIAGGFAFGAAATSKYHDATKICPDDHCASDADASSETAGIATSKHLATASDVLVIVGAAAVAGGIVLVLSSRARVAPSAAPGGGGLVLGGELR